MIAPEPHAGASDSVSTSDRDATLDRAFRIDALHGLLWTYAALVFYTTLLPFRFRTHDDLAAVIGRVAWHPFQLAAGRPTPLFDVLYNIGFFVPLGLLAWATRHVWLAHVRSETWRVACCVAVGTSLSLCVEIGQIWTSSRTPATSDVLANGTGALCGVLLAAALGRWLRSERAHALRVWVEGEPLAVPMLGMIVLQALHALVPFNFSWEARDWWSALQQVRFVPWRGPTNGVLPLDPVLFSALLAGIADRVASRQHAGAARLVRALGLAFALSIVLEFVQLGLESRVTSWFDILGALMGAMVGVTLSRILAAQRAPIAVVRWIAVAYALSLIVITLYPIESPLDAAAIRERIAGWFVHGSMPAAATRSIVHELLNVLMLYVPFGYLIAYALHGERRVHAPGLLLSVIMLCSVLALGLGVLRILIPAGDVSPGHVAPATLGGLAGAFVWWWRRRPEQIRSQEAPGSA